MQQIYNYNKSLEKDITSISITNKQMKNLYNKKRQTKDLSFVETFINQNMFINQKLIQNFNHLSHELENKQIKNRQNTQKMVQSIKAFKMMFRQFGKECKTQWVNIYKEVLDIFATIIQAYQDKLYNLQSTVAQKNIQIEHLMKYYQPSTKDSLLSSTNYMNNYQTNNTHPLNFQSGESVVLYHDQESTMINEKEREKGFLLSKNMKKEVQSTNKSEGSRKQSRDNSIKHKNSMDSKMKQQLLQKDDMLQNFTFSNYQSYNSSQELKYLACSLTKVNNNSTLKQSIEMNQRPYNFRPQESHPNHRKIDYEFSPIRKRKSNCQNQQFYSNHNSKLQNLRRSILNRKKKDSRSFDKIF